MPLTWVLDVFLGLALIAFAVRGYGAGLIRGASGMAGLFGGGLVAILTIPFVGRWVPEAEWRIPATLAAGLMIVLGGYAVGISIGRSLRRRVERSRLRFLDRLFGMVVSAVGAALVASMVAFGIGSLGVPVLSQAIASSVVLRTIDDATPDPLRALSAQLRSTVLQDGLPRIAQAFTAPLPTIPDIDTGTSNLANASRSVVRITGNAFRCAQSQSGSGFVVAPDRVLTNAHVVAGVGEPVVEVPGGGVHVAQIVYFDPIDDLAVLAVDGLTAQPLPFAPTLAEGSTGVIDGYPLGGPFSSHAARVVSVDTILVPDIHGRNPSPRQVYVLAAEVQPGESGGPLLTEGGAVAGVVFAKGETHANLGYALTMEEVAPVLARAESLASPVSSGSCASR